MLAQSLVLSFTCIIQLTCILHSFYIPWAKPIVPVSRGIFSLNIPMEIGLFQCFSSICQKYKELNNFLVDTNTENPWSSKPRKQPTDTDSLSKHPSIAPSFSPSVSISVLSVKPAFPSSISPSTVSGFPSLSPSASSGSPLPAPSSNTLLPSFSPTTADVIFSTAVGGVSLESKGRTPINPPKLPKIPFPSVPNPFEKEKESVETFLIPFKQASIAALLCLSFPILIGSFLLLLIVYEKITRFLLLTSNSKLILLLLNTFCCFLSVLSYLFFTFSHLNNGIYIDGIWVIGYASIFGLLCCILLKILENSEEIHRIHNSVNDYYENQSRNHSPVRIGRTNGTVVAPSFFQRIGSDTSSTGGVRETEMIPLLSTPQRNNGKQQRSKMQQFQQTAVDTETPNSSAKREKRFLQQQQALHLPLSLKQQLNPFNFLFGNREIGQDGKSETIMPRSDSEASKYPSYHQRPTSSSLIV
jgi:hypothetical protein